MFKKINVKFFVIAIVLLASNFFAVHFANAGTKANDVTCVQGGECQSSYCSPAGICATIGGAVAPAKPLLQIGEDCKGDPTACQSGYCPNLLCESLVPAGTPDAPAAGNVSGGLVTCGRTGQPMCTLCDLIVGINVIIKYGFGISIIVALAFIVVGAVMYIVSAGDTGMIESAKTTMKNAIIGILIVFTAWLIVNYTMKAIGTNSNLGIQVTGWDSFKCSGS